MALWNGVGAYFAPTPFLVTIYRNERIIVEEIYYDLHGINVIS